MSASRHVPWTERFRPRSLNEVVLPSSTKLKICNWWRAWKIWWICFLRVRREYDKWSQFLREAKGRTWWARYKARWRSFFLREFESKFGVSAAARGVPDSHRELFQGTGRYVTFEFRPGAKEKIVRWLEETWSAFVRNIKSKEVPPAIPPIPPYKPLLLVGPPGTGKTSTAWALAFDEGIEIIEFNASDQRTGKFVREVLGSVVKSFGFTITEDKPPRILLFDEVDGMHGTVDRGGFSALVQLLDETCVPIILCANDMTDSRVRFLMTKCITVFYDRPTPDLALKFAKMIIQKARISVPPEVLERLKWAPDYRTIVEALETYAYTGVLPALDHTEMISLYDAIRFAFSLKSDTLEKTLWRVKSYLSGTDMDPWDILLWAWENASKFVDAENLYKFYSELAYADYVYKSAMLRQNWRVAYKILDIVAYAMAKYGRPEKNIWKLRRIKIDKPTIVEEIVKMRKLLFGEEETTTTTAAEREETEEEEKEEEEEKAEEEEELLEEAPKSGIAAFLWSYARFTHTSRKQAVYELKFLKWLAEKNPEGFGRACARMQAPRDAVAAFCSHFKIKNVSTILKAYDDEMAKIAAESLTVAPAVMPPVPAKPAEEKPAKTREEKRKEEKKRAPSLLEFLR